MPRRIDIGGHFERLTRRGPGGRRLDAGDVAGTSSSDADDEPGEGDGDAPGDTPADAPGETPGDDSESSRGGLADVLKDTLGRGRSTARRTAGAVKAKVPRLARRKSEEPLPPESVVTIEYSPRRDGDPDPGEVVWARVPFEEDPSQGKDRPVVIIGRRGHVLVGVPLTTKRNEREAQLNLGTGGWDPKRRTSYARIWRMLDLDAGATRREGAVLDERRFDALVKAVDRYYDIRRPASSRADDPFDADY